MKKKEVQKAKKKARKKERRKERKKERKKKERLLACQNNFNSHDGCFNFGINRLFCSKQSLKMKNCFFSTKGQNCFRQLETVPRTTFIPQIESLLTKRRKEKQRKTGKERLTERKSERKR